MSDKEGGSAFPVHNAHEQITEYGMTLRDYFAGQALVAMQSLITDSFQGPNRIASAAYEIADAMLREREEK